MIGLSACALLGGCTFVKALGLESANDSTRAELINAPPIEIPFREAKDFLVLRARVNGSRSVDLLLDTGASALFMFETEAVKAAGLSARDAGFIMPGIKGQIHEQLDLDFGGLILHDQTALVVPLSVFDCPGKTRDAGVDGVIGYDLFRRFVVEVDFDRSVMTLHDPSRFVYRGSGLQLPLHFQGRLPGVFGTWTGQTGAPMPLNVLLDTGASSELVVFENDAEERRAPLNAQPSEPGCMAGRTLERKQGPSTDLNIAGNRIEIGRTEYAKELNERWTGLLGAQVLNRYKLIFDYSRRKLMLELRNYIVPR